MPVTAQQTTPLKTSEAAAALACAINVKQPMIFWGHPGVGKTQISEQVARAQGPNFGYLDFRVCQMGETDLRGFPIKTPDGKNMIWAPPIELPTSGSGLIVLEEFNRASMSMQNACLQLSLERRIGAYQLPDGWAVTACCNQEDRGVIQMSAATLSRFTHIDVIVDLEDYSAWALKAGLEPVVRGFIRFRPELLHVYDKNARAFPCPRSWAMVSKFVSQGLSTKILLAMVIGTVGYGAAIEFMAFYDTFNHLPNLDAILIDPAGSAIPTDPSLMYAVAGGLAARATSSTFGRVIQYLNRMMSEYNVFGVTTAIRRLPALKTTREFTDWSVLNSSVLF